MRMAMRFTNPDHYFEQIAQSRAPQKIRLQALQSVKYPTASFLLRLLRGDAPAKLKAAAALRYREIFERKKNHASNTTKSTLLD
jgi:hypothetical protein